MKSFIFNILSKTAGILVVMFFVFTSCQPNKDEVMSTYHHKIHLDRQFCDTFGNGYFDYYYDAQNKLLRTEWALNGNNTPDSEDIQYSGNTILVQSNTYLLDTQNHVIKITRSNTERSYEYEGNLRIKETYNGEGGNDYVIFSKYHNDRLVSDSTIYTNFTAVTKYFLTDILRPDYMIDDMWGITEFKPRSKYLERLTVERNYYNGVAGSSVDSVFYTYQIETNRIECNVSRVETPKRSDNCKEYKLVYTLEYPNK
jgi:hypothetical protein